MIESDYSKWLEVSVKEYAEDHARAGGFSQQSALEQARKEFASLLPNGTSTKDHYLYSVVDNESSQKVGVIWFAINRPGNPDIAFIYDIRIDDSHRGEGYGTAAMLLLESKVKELGKNKIMLHVFAHNVEAKKLYEKLGYEPTNFVMAKTLA
jgi:RimJ/RimL family protein N-acetyltransferase